MTTTNQNGKGSHYRKVDPKKWESSPVWEALEKQKKEQEEKAKKETENE